MPESTSPTPSQIFKWAVVPYGVFGGIFVALLGWQIGFLFIFSGPALWSGFAVAQKLLSDGEIELIALIRATTLIGGALAFWWLFC
jgi:hypothetical protein